MKFLKHELGPILLTLSILSIVLIGTTVYAFVYMTSLSAKVTTLTKDTNTLNSQMTSLTTRLASTTDELLATIGQTRTSLSSALSDTQQNVQQQLGGVQNQVGSLTGTLSNIQKLSQLDSQLLEKYSKVYFLNENYIPAHLATIPLTYQYSSSKQLLFYTDALPHLLSMLDTASSTGVKLYVASAYRSFAEQSALKGEYKVTYGAGTANSFSADQGYSEHQLGTAVDMITTGLGGSLDGFDTTSAYTWMTQNAYKYGFILSYPKGNTYYVYEPWHWRFVGIKLATDLHNQNKNFYDMDQRTIDTYLINIFDNN